MKIRNILISSVSALLLVGCGLNTKGDEANDIEGNIDASAIIQKAGCSTTACHGSNLDGVNGNGVNLKNKSRESLIEALKIRRDGTGGSATMQNVAKNFTDEEIEALATYLTNPTVAGASTGIENITKSFKDYATNSQKWKKIETLFGADPAIDPALSITHGTGKFFRTIYKSPVDAKIVTEGYPDGTMFVKELRTDNDGVSGKLTGATTVMKKENGQWTYIKLNPTLTQIEAMGNPDETTKIGSVSKCIGCHSGAKEGDDFTFPPSSPLKDKESSLSDFKGYEKWTLIEEVRGNDPAGLISDKHGNGANLFRRIYKKQLTEKVNGQYPVGTIFLKELRKPKVDDNTSIGELAGAITVMIKRKAGTPQTNNWEYLMADTTLSTVIVKGQEGSGVAGCISCHTAAQNLEPNKTKNDYIFPRSANVVSTGNTGSSPSTGTKLSKGKEVFDRIGCATCHGSNGEGVSAPRLNNQDSETLEVKLKARKAKTAGGSTMQGIANRLSDEEIENVALYSASLGK